MRISAGASWSYLQRLRFLATNTREECPRFLNDSALCVSAQTPPLMDAITSLNSALEIYLSTSGIGSATLFFEPPVIFAKRAELRDDVFSASTAPHLLSIGVLVH